MTPSERTKALYAKFMNFSPSRGDQRRIKILEKTIELIGSQRGIEGTSFESIGKSLGMLRAHVAYYYPDRDALIEAAIKLVIATGQSYTIEHVQNASEDGISKLEAYINGNFTWLNDFPKHHSVVLLFYYYGSYDKRYRKMADQARTYGIERVKAAISPLFEGTSQKRMVSQAAKIIHDIILGRIIDYFIMHPKAPIDPIRRRTVKEVQAYISSLLN